MSAGIMTAKEYIVQFDTSGLKGKSTAYVIAKIAIGDPTIPQQGTNWYGFDTRLFAVPLEKRVKEEKKPKKESVHGIEVYYKKDHRNNWDIYLTENGKERRLTTHSAADMSPSLSPDRKNIAFTSNKRGKKKWSIYIVDIEGKNRKEVQMIRWMQRADPPKWSEDSKKILWTDNGSARSFSREEKKWKNYPYNTSYEVDIETRKKKPLEAPNGIQLKRQLSK